VAEPADQTLGVVGQDEAGHGLAELVDVVVQLGPEALLFEGADPPLGAAVGLRNVDSETMERVERGGLDPGGVQVLGCCGRSPSMSTDT
jgi:hypothetical protein